MPPELPDYQQLVHAAVGSYWNVRQSQAERSRAQGVLNTGTRAEVTGGRHLDDLQALLVRVFVDAGIPAHLMDVKKRPIPGYFRRDKSWDVVVMVADRVVGIIELKSMARTPIESARHPVADSGESIRDQQARLAWLDRTYSRSSVGRQEHEWFLPTVDRARAIRASPQNRKCSTALLMRSILLFE